MLGSWMRSIGLESLVYRLRVFSFGPPLVAFAVLYLLAVSPQMREVYLGIIEDGDLARGGLGLLALTLLSSLVYTWHYWVATDTIDHIYPLHADLELDRGLMSWRDGKAIFCAAAPILGLAVGLLMLYGAASSAGAKLDAILAWFAPVAGAGLADDFGATSRLLGRLPFYIAAGAILMCLAIVAIHGLLRRAGLGRRLRLATTALSAAITLFMAVFPLLLPDRVVTISRLLGPLATIALTLVAIVTALMAFSWVLRRLEPSVLAASLVVLIAGAAFYLLVASLLAEQNTASKRAYAATGAAPAVAKSDEEIRAAFREWFARRADRPQFAGRPYPVFLLTGQGGGIYATSAASAFLASLQDECANFAQHVFAISGVSGGAVGAALFNAWMAGREQSAEPCRGGRGQRLTAFMQSVTEADHLSPVIALVAPDLLRKAPLLDRLRPDFDRSSVLERSFACSFDESSSGAAAARPGGCGPATGSGGLRTPFQQHWSSAGAAPAVVLNTTWSEKGYRVAFAPFPLHAIGDGTLYGFSELPLQRDGAARSLIEAAFVSARFPGIVPAWRAERGTGEAAEWSFVDGAYVDNSGATTALELYKLIEDMIRKEGLDIDLRLVLLTDAETALDFGAIEGSGGADVIAPAVALLNVRSQLSQRAVTQAIEYVTRRRRSEPSDRRTTGEEHVLSVDVEQQTFPLPLGWKISNVTNDVVRLMMGRPDLCPSSRRQAPARREEFAAVRSYLRTIENNSCVKKKIVELLGGAD